MFLAFSAKVKGRSRIIRTCAGRNVKQILHIRILLKVDLKLYELPAKGVGAEAGRLPNAVFRILFFRYQSIFCIYKSSFSAENQHPCRTLPEGGLHITVAENYEPFMEMEWDSREQVCLPLLQTSGKCVKVMNSIPVRSPMPKSLKNIPPAPYDQY